MEIAGAYLSRNHPILDGNKRSAMMAAIIFLRLNGIEPALDSEQWEKLILALAGSELDRDQTTKRRLRRLLKPPPRRKSEIAAPAPRNNK